MEVFLIEFGWIWKAILITIVGATLLRISGRRSISQMTVAQTVIMISIGTILIQPVSEKNIWVTFLTAALLILSLLLLEYIQLKSNVFERLLTGQAVTVIENGQLDVQNLKKLRMSVDKLEMRLRQKNISCISDVQWATIEPSGQLGYILIESKQTATKGDIEQLKQWITTSVGSLNDASFIPPYVPPVQTETDIQTDNFTEVQRGENRPKPPEYLE